MNLTDQDIAGSFLKWKKKRYPGALPQHLASYLQSYLAARTWYTDMVSIDRVMLFNRVLTSIRSEGGKAAAVTRKKDKKRAVEQREKQRQGVLL